MKYFCSGAVRPLTLDQICTMIIERVTKYGMVDVVIFVNINKTVTLVRRIPRSDCKEKRVLAVLSFQTPYIQCIYLYDRLDIYGVYICMIEQRVSDCVQFPRFTFVHRNINL